MPHLEVLRFPRGFLLSERPVEPPPTFIPGPVLPHFWVHPWTHVEHAGDQGLFVIVIGHAVPTAPEQSVDPASWLLSRLRESEAAFFAALSEYGGRHAVIFGAAGNLRIVNDAAGMRSVFYHSRGGVAASHALLVDRAVGGAGVVDPMPFQYGYPGNRTPYPGVRVLTANTYYWVTAGVVRRFWPVHRLAPSTVDHAAQVLLDRSVYALQHIAQGRDVRLTLTAGLDSRTILAIALASGVPFEAYTYGDDEGTDVDRGVAADLAALAGIPHTVVGPRVEEPASLEYFDEVNYMGHHVPWLEPLLEYFPNRDTVALLGNALEIGRSNTMSQRRYKNLRPVTAVAMMHLHHRRMSPRYREESKHFGSDVFRATSEMAFQGFIDDTGYDLVAEMLNPFDLFYWEHRMSAWQAHAMNERDFYGVSFIPFNSRSIYESMLGVPEPQRYADETVYRMIEMVDPQLLELPVNPQVWPTDELASIR